MIFLLNQTSSVGNIVSFREAKLYVVILMLKSTLFYFLLLYLCGQQEDNIFTAIAIQDQRQAVVLFPQSYSRRQKSVLQNNFKEGKLHAN